MNKYLVVTAAATQVRDFQWLTHHIPSEARVVATDITSGMAVIGIMGPQSRAFLQSLTPNDMSNDAFPFGTSREIEIAYSFVRASRITYVGELGWELYIPTEQALGVYDSLVAAGESFELRHIGMHAMNSLRLEKAYRHWGHDITDEDTPLEAGLGFAVDMKKEGGFIGKEALEKQQKFGIKKRLVNFALTDPEPLLYHNEPIWRDAEIVGYITSGMFCHTVGRAVGLGYVNHVDTVSMETLLSGNFEIEVAGKRFAATATTRPLYDPTNERIRN
jgi:4-methylaminobutanoate oxidase (formaldehyde-forming)